MVILFLGRSQYVPACRRKDLEEREARLAQKIVDGRALLADKPLSGVDRQKLEPRYGAGSFDQRWNDGIHGRGMLC